MTKKHGASKMIFWIHGRRRPESIVFDGRHSVLELAISNQIPLPTSCGGMGTCTACRVFIKSNLTKAPERNEIEAEMARDRDFDARERLGCQLEAYDGLEVEIPPRSYSEEDK